MVKMVSWIKVGIARVLLGMNINCLTHQECMPLDNPTTSSGRWGQIGSLRYQKKKG